MKIKNIKIENIASFLDFNTTKEFEKNSLIFGTNGSGKSTVSTLIQMIDNYYKNSKSEVYLTELKQYLDNQYSKESLGKKSKILINFSSQDFELQYSMQTGEVIITKDNWYPVRVFNNIYTEKTIGKTIDINLADNDLIIGEPNKKLDTAQKQRDGLIKKKEAFQLQIELEIESAISSYKANTNNSNADVTQTISQKNLLAEENPFENIKNAIKDRKKLGFETPVDNLKTISYKSFDSIIDINKYQEVFKEVIEKPVLNKEEEKLLLNYTEFYKKGMETAKLLDNKCPFCFQGWKDSENKIASYKLFLESTYNNKKAIVLNLKDNLNSLNEEIGRINTFISTTKDLVITEGKKYDISTSDFSIITINEDLNKNILDAVTLKQTNMKEVIEIVPKIETLFSYYKNEISKRDKVVTEIKDFISTIRSKRTKANKEVSKQIMSEAWTKNMSKRNTLNKTVKEIEAVEEQILEIENLDIDQDTICSIFNDLVSFLGLSEYKMNNDKKLVLNLNRDYDITNEAGRISSAQKKILSLCYFFAEIISELKTENDLKNYTLIFDDPVDSADYNYFHSITALLESLEIVLKKVLKKTNIKIGQIIVLTHNSLLHDRLAQNFGFNKTIKKENNVSIMTSSEKTTNNYKTYLEYIVRYYKNPKSSKKEMIFIGNIIRRVLEILSNFNNLDSNNFREFILGIGKPKLALIANHLSHESFTKVLNPLSSEKELQEACKELFEVIKDSHPLQYNYIEEEMLNK